jgi:hypothetical protein
MVDWYENDPRVGVTDRPWVAPTSWRVELQMSSVDSWNEGLLYLV